MRQRVWWMVKETIFQLEKYKISQSLTRGDFHCASQSCWIWPSIWQLNHFQWYLSFSMERRKKIKNRLSAPTNYSSIIGHLKQYFGELVNLIEFPLNLLIASSTSKPFPTQIQFCGLEISMGKLVLVPWWYSHIIVDGNWSELYIHLRDLLQSCEELGGERWG